MKYHFYFFFQKHLFFSFVPLWISLITCFSLQGESKVNESGFRELQLLDTGWRFMKYATAEDADDLIYDVRPDDIRNSWDDIPADTKPTEAEEIEVDRFVLKPWILPSGNDFLLDPATRHRRPDGNPGGDFPFVQLDFDDSQWESVTIPHDWAISGPFFEGDNPEVGGGMGRLPSPGVAWYRNTFDLSDEDAGKQIVLKVDGAMSYAMVWLNGQLVGGWPFGYASWQLDLTPYIKLGTGNQLAIRLDNPPASSRWYPGGGIFRNVWLEKTNAVHVSQWGVQIDTSEVSKEAALLRVRASVQNDGQEAVQASVVTEVYTFCLDNEQSSNSVLVIDGGEVSLESGERKTVVSEDSLENPELWKPLPEGIPHLYKAVTTVSIGDQTVDRYETRFGIRKLEFDPDRGLLVNGKHVRIFGVNQHHDLGALGAAFNRRAAQRQLEILRDMGCNAIRMAHNPPAPELLDLCDEMGFLVCNESFDVWQRKKTGLGFHLIFDDWHEQDMRALVRRDYNHPSVVMWSVGNEVGEQYTDEAGAAVAAMLSNIVREEDPYRPTTASMNWAKPEMPFPAAMDLISLNYQGEGIRQDPIFEGTNRIQTPPMYSSFHKEHPDKVILSSESASAFSSRGVYVFPVHDGKTSYVRDGIGGDDKTAQVSSYELYAVDFGVAADVVFEKQDKNPFVAGEFVWSGFDYLGEPTPYYSSRSSYCGIIDLAGFPKNRFYLYQSRWREDYPMAHILPHWNWPDRVGQITPVHVFTSGDQAELFLNGKSLGKKSKAAYEYRLRWDDVIYEPGELKVVAYKAGKKWAESSVETTDTAAGIQLQADRNVISADGKDLSFITLEIVDGSGRFVETAENEITFSIEGPGVIIATDNGNAADLTAFPSLKRHAFSGKALAIVSGIDGESGEVVLKAEAEGLKSYSITIQTK